VAAAAKENAPVVNSAGMTLVPIAPGSFEMGVDSTPLPLKITKGVSGASWDRTGQEGDYDEVPVHRVAISQPFLIAQTEVTVEQYRQFRPDYQGNKYWSPYAAGISWEEAMAYCTWLSKKEGKSYRLPTEAEWEYVCRAGTRTMFPSGAEPDAEGVANSWGVKNMQASVPEWCLDWHGRYPAAAQTDPVGPAGGFAKVVRGGGMDHRAAPKNDGGKFFPAEQPYYRRSANRASAAPDFSSPEGHIGFRVVQADMPATKPTPADRYFFQTAIKQQSPDLTHGPDPTKPYYHTRPMFPNLGELKMHTVGWKIGFMPGLGQAWHNTAVQICENGDLVAAYYNVPQWENEVDQSIVTMRLRRGADEWDMPEPWPDFADRRAAVPIHDLAGQRRDLERRDHAGVRGQGGRIHAAAGQQHRARCERDDLRARGRRRQHHRSLCDEQRRQDLARYGRPFRRAAHHLRAGQGRIHHRLRRQEQQPRGHDAALGLA
jgi:formylglycine-generating enzyme required for sulfatase activity